MNWLRAKWKGLKLFVWRKLVALVEAQDREDDSGWP